MKRFFLLTVSLFLLATGLFAAKKPPLWMLDVNEVYPNADYIAYIGEGASRSAAEIDAQIKISRYFDSSIETKTDAAVEMSSKEGKTSQKQALNTKTTVTSASDLFAIHYSSPYTDRKAKKTYIVGFIERKEAYKIYRPAVNKPALEFSGFYTKGLNAAKKGDLLRAAIYFKSAQKHAADFEKEYEFASLISTKLASEYETIHQQASGIDSAVQKILLNCPVNISVINDMDDIILTKAKILFSRYGFPVSSEPDAYNVTVTVTISKNQQKKGTSCYPSVVTVISQDDEAIISFGKEGEKVAAVNEDVAVRRTYTSVEKLLEESFNIEFFQ